MKIVINRMHEEAQLVQAAAWLQAGVSRCSASSSRWGWLLVEGRSEVDLMLVRSYSKGVLGSSASISTVI